MNSLMKSSSVQLIILASFVFTIKGCKQNEEIRLEKIIFHTSRCMGSCPEYHAQIDNDRLILLHAEYVSKSSTPINLYDPDTARMGYFKGKVREEHYAELEGVLQNIRLSHLRFNGITCCDASVITIIIYYNNQRKVLQSMLPPKEAMKLIDLLRHIVESTPVQRAAEPFELESLE